MLQKVLDIAYEASWSLRHSDNLAWFIAHKINKHMNLWLDIPDQYQQWWHWQDSIFVRTDSASMWLTLTKTRVNMKWWFPEEIARKLYDLYIQSWIEYTLRTKRNFSKSCNVYILSNGKQKIVLDYNLNIIKDDFWKRPNKK